MKNIWPMALRPITGYREPAGRLVADHYRDRGEDLQRAEDEGDPAPGAQVADHVVRVGDEYVRVGDRGDAVDQVEDADHPQQRGREDDHQVPSPRLASLVCLIVADVISVSQR